MQMTAVKTDDATAVAAVEPREFLNTLVWIKADGSSTAGTQSLIEIRPPPAGRRRGTTTLPTTSISTYSKVR